MATSADASGSLREIYRATIADVYGYLLAHTGGDRVLAEELTAETYFHAARAFEVGKGHQVNIAWLKTVAKRRLIDHLRRQQRVEQRANRLADETRTNPAGVVMNPDTSAEAQHVYDTLARLSDEHRLVLVLQHFDGLSVREIADAMERSERSVEGLLRRARQAFRSAHEASAERAHDDEEASDA